MISGGTDFFVGGDGLRVVPRVFSRGELAAHAARVSDYVRRGGRLLNRGGLLGTQAGGWYVSGWNEDPLLAPLGDALHGSARLHAALREVFGARPYRGPLSAARAATSHEA